MRKMSPENVKFKVAEIFKINCFETNIFLAFSLKHEVVTHQNNFRIYTAYAYVEKIT